MRTSKRLTLIAAGVAGLVCQANAQYAGGYGVYAAYGGYAGFGYGTYAGVYTPYDLYSFGSTVEYAGRPIIQTVSHLRYIDLRTFRHHVFENVVDQRVFHTGEYRRTRISGDIYTPSYRMARQMYQEGY